MRRFAFISLLVAAAAQAGRQDLTVSYTRHGSEFDLKVTQTFSPDVTWEQALAVHRDPLLIGQISNYFVESRLMDVVRPNEFFRLALTAQDTGMRKLIVNRCRETATATTWNRDCEIALNEGEGAHHFQWGQPSTHCSWANNQATCVVGFRARPKGFNYIVIRRSDEDFGILLAAVTIDDTAKLGHLVLGQTPATVRAAFELGPYGNVSRAYRDLAQRRLREVGRNDFTIVSDAAGRVSVR